MRWLERAARHLPVVGRPLRWFARLCDKLALDSRGEIALMESNRAVSVGFGLSTAVVLATPLLNLLFRPIIIAGSSHLLGQIEKNEVQLQLPQPRPAIAPNGAGTRISAHAR